MATEIGHQARSLSFFSNYSRILAPSNARILALDVHGGPETCVHRTADHIEPYQQRGQRALSACIFSLS